MNVICKRRLIEAGKAHPDAAEELLNWYKNARKARWANFAEVRATFRTADQAKKCIIFNIRRNRYRLIVLITRDWKRVLIRHVMTHAEYDLNRWKADCGY